MTAIPIEASNGSHFNYIYSVPSFVTDSAYVELGVPDVINATGTKTRIGPEAAETVNRPSSGFARVSDLQERASKHDPEPRTLLSPLYGTGSPVASRGIYEILNNFAELNENYHTLPAGYRLQSLPRIDSDSCQRARPIPAKPDETTINRSRPDRSRSNSSIGTADHETALSVRYSKVSTDDSNFECSVTSLADLPFMSGTFLLSISAMSVKVPAVPLRAYVRK